MNVSLTLDEVLPLIPDAVVEGSTSVTEIKGISSLDTAREEDLSFLGNSKYKSQVPLTSASVVLLPEDYVGAAQRKTNFLSGSKNPRGGWPKFVVFWRKEFHLLLLPGFMKRPSSIAKPRLPMAFSSGLSFVGSHVSIGPNSVIGSHCHLGDHVSRLVNPAELIPGVKILSRCLIGDRVILNAGVVIGSEGYGFEQVGDSHEKVPHLGLVVVEEDVEIGANTCIDRARFDETRIGAGTKIDNLVQIGHNVQIGKGCLIVAQVGISGSVRFEDHVVVGGQAGFAGHLKVGKGAKIAGQAGITKDVEAGAFQG